MGEWLNEYSSTILDLGTRCEWVVSFTSRPLYLRVKSPRYPLDRSMAGPQIRSGRRGVERNLFLLPGIEPQSCSTLLYRLSYKELKRGTVMQVLCYELGDQGSTGRDSTTNIADKTAGAWSWKMDDVKNVHSSFLSAVHLHDVALN
jgi:hypothetical protein